jgi:general secretion pathway protein I
LKKITPIQQGFTLIEMLIALVIVSISFSAIILAVNENVRTLSKLQETVAASWVSEDVITRAQLGLLKGNSGTQRILNKEWLWRIQVKSTENAYVQQLIVTVDNEHQVTVLTITAYNGVNHAR